MAIARSNFLWFVAILSRLEPLHAQHDFNWIDKIVPRLQNDTSTAGDSAFDKVAEALQERYEDWGIKASMFPHLPSLSFVNISMTDGTSLYSIVVNPWPYYKKKATCLVRSPYGSKASQNLALVFLALNGFAAVMQEDRGFFRSGGDFDLWRGAAQDGKDTMAWIGRQPWSNGQVFSVGGSADGIAAAEEILSHPKQLHGEWLIWTTGNARHFIYPGGAFRQELLEGYMQHMSAASHGASEDHVLPAVEEHEDYGRWWSNVSDCIPSTTVDRCFYTNVKWPVVLSAGWWDIFQKTNLDAWRGLRTLSYPNVRDRHVLFVGPLGHCIAGVPGTKNPETLMLRTQEALGLVMAALVASEFFGGEMEEKNRQRVGRVNLFVMGAFDRLPGLVPGNYWTSLDSFPETTPLSLYLGMDGRLTHTSAAVGGSIGFVYDPSDPTPMIGGNNLPDLPGPAGARLCGTAVQSSRENRSDVISFTSGYLSDDLAIVGPLVARLFVSSSAKDTDFVVTVSDVTPLGESMLIRYGAQRMRWRSGDLNESQPMQVGRVYQIDVQMASIAYIFPGNHRVRVTVASAAAPYYNPTSNTGVNDMVVKVTPVVAHNDVHFGRKHPSALILPRVRKDQIPANPRFYPVRDVGAPTESWSDLRTTPIVV